MKMIYTHENRFMVSNVQNILQNAGIECILKNEFIAGAAGDLSPFDTWMEVWVEDEDAERATQIVADVYHSDSSQDWCCQNCKERNEAGFEICWNCQQEREF